ncbi:ABC transporter substrate-binding protein [Bacillus sp. SA1-12]|uniref:sugar ABC transporter substrate-binding protein n=1 Tax=Bacillus sp. SA1-12 TaxID=1455638 RepID=UPI00062635B1|nr:maltose ABC transporter substrate-binding protein [Bacillus sp. SA1-12]KKI92691.1 ABC transporter substrate-binding protein [Bacillus sp. SA1-12]
MLKKLINLSIVALLTFVLAACNKPGQTQSTSKGKESGSEGKEVITEEIEPEEGAELVVWGNGNAEGEWMKSVAEQFTAKYDVPVKFEEVGHGDAVGKLQTDGPAGLGGDVFIGPHDRLGEMLSSGLIYENPFVDEYKERLVDGVAEAVSYKEENEIKLYGYPLATETLAMAYNKDLLDKMGFKPAETWDELIEQSREFMNQNPGTYGFMLEPGNLYALYSLIGGYGGYIFGDNNTNPNDIGLNKEPSLKAAALLEKIRDEIVPLKKEDLTADVISSYFNEGKQLYTIEGPWGVQGRLDAGINLGIMPMPKLDNGEVPTTFLGVKALYVNSYSKYPQAAALFAKFATSDEMLLIHFEQTGDLPVTKALLENEKFKSDQLKVGFMEQVKYAIPMPNITEMGSVWDGINAAFTAIWNNDAEPQEAFDKGVQLVEEAINSQTK